VTLRGYAEQAATWWGRTADLEFRPFDAFAATTTEEQAATTLDHIARSPSASIEAAREHLGYAPRFSSLDTAREAVAALAAREGSGIPPLQG
jgi:hypothetical protein